MLWDFPGLYPECGYTASRCGSLEFAAGELPGQLGKRSGVECLSVQQAFEKGVDAEERLGGQARQGCAGPGDKLLAVQLRLIARLRRQPILRRRPPDWPRAPLEPEARPRRLQEKPSTT